MAPSRSAVTAGRIGPRALRVNQERMRSNIAPNWFGTYAASSDPAYRFPASIGIEHRSKSQCRTRWIDCATGHATNDLPFMHRYTGFVARD